MSLLMFHIHLSSPRDVVSPPAAPVGSLSQSLSQILPKAWAAPDSQSKPNSPVGIRPCQALNKHREPCCVVRHRFQRTRGLQQGAARDRMFCGYHPLGQAMKRLISAAHCSNFHCLCCTTARGPSGGTNHLFPVLFPISGRPMRTNAVPEQHRECQLLQSLLLQSLEYPQTPSPDRGDSLV